MSRFIPLATHPTQTLDGTDAARSAAHILPEGARLRDHEIVGCIGEGGFGVVYLAWDPAVAQHIAIKEYLPAALASRASASPSVVVKSQRHMGPFRSGLQSFVQEARTLAQFDHPALVRVLDFWEANGTAYMAMPYYVGPTLGQAVLDLGHPPDEATLRGWLGPLLDALEALHAVGCLHRDIAPDNILLTQEGPVLLDFGAARHVVAGGVAHVPTVIFKPGFAPIEQYGHVASMKQGAWTDLYALAAVMHAAITGQPPQPSIERLMDDRLQPLSERVPGQYSAPFLAAIDAALALHPDNRPQDVAAFRKQLGREAPREAAQRLPPPPVKPQAPAARTVPPVPIARRDRLPLWLGGALLLLVAGVVASLWPSGEPVRLAPPAAVVLAPEPVPAPVAVPMPPLAPALAPGPAPAPAPAPPALTAAVPPVHAARKPAPRAAPPAVAERLDSRCADLLQRASLEALRPGEAAFLRKECQR